MHLELQFQGSWAPLRFVAWQPELGRSGSDDDTSFQRGSGRQTRPDNQLHPTRRTVGIDKMAQVPVQTIHRDPQLLYAAQSVAGSGLNG
jgi:hypothetical protein